MSIIWTDDFSHNYFADSTYAQQGYAAPTVAAHALTMVDSTTWEDQRHALPANFTMVTVWANIVSLDDTAAALAVGLHAPFIVVGVERDGLLREGIVGAATNTDGLDGGIAVGGATPLVEFAAAVNDRWTGAGVLVPGESVSAEPVTRGHIAGGRVALVLTPDGVVTVSSPDGTVLTYTVPLVMLDTWLTEAIYPFVNVSPGAGAATVLDSWGYEIDFATPPSTVVAGQGATGALKR